MMDLRRSLIAMLKALDEETNELHQQGAGYYSCVPMIRRYNKLLSQASDNFPEAAGLMGTFEYWEESDPKDPADKMTVIQGLRVEIGQLVTLLESMSEE